MAAALKSFAASAVNTGLPSSFYSNDSSNPIYQSLEQEIHLFCAFMKRRCNPGYKKPSDEASSRASDSLFELWNKYDSKLPLVYYQKKLLEMGDFLVSIHEYNLALWQCYGRYLKHFGDVNVEEITDVTEFKKTFFPRGFATEDAGFTFRALMGKTICTYQYVRMTDNKLQNVQSVEKCVHLLNFLRLVTQVILPNESLCWLVFNGTVHIYSISRHLMSLGHTAKVVEYLLWACMCMESSVPLLGVRYLTWRTTLYTAVCQCYYDCKAGQYAEAFARRALTKINELSDLENMSNAAESLETHMTFRLSTVKMAIMVYRRTVFETRRKPKGFHRPRNRANLKDAAQLMWPRTQTEKLLVEMFEHVEGSAAQMMCLIETLSDSNRRTLLSSPPAQDNEVEILDVYAELFMACQEIIAGGGGNQGSSPPKMASDIKIAGFGGVVKEKSLIDMAAKGEDGVPLSAVVKVVKLAYCYEQWEMFDNMIDNTIAALKEANDPKYGPELKAMEILKAYDKVMARTKQRRQHEEEGDEDGALPLPHAKQAAVNQTDLIQLAEILLSVITGLYSQEELDMDMIVDACLALWSRCKTVFQKVQTGSSDNPKYLQKMDNPSKWVYILDIVHQVMGWCGLSAVDPALTAEVALRLALAFEASAAIEAESKSKAGKSNTKIELEDDQSLVSASKLDVGAETQGQSLGVSQSSLASQTVLQRGVRQQLLQARDILELGLHNVSQARQAVAVSDTTAIADVSWAKELNKELFRPLTREEIEPTKAAEDGTTADEAAAAAGTGEATALWSLVQDLHLELTFIYHRICLKLAAFKPEPKSKATKPFKRRTCSHLEYGSSGEISHAYIESYEELVSNCRKNSLSKALLCMQRALGTTKSTGASTQQKALLQEAKEYILKTQTEEKKLYVDSNEAHNKANQARKVPPAPILLSRTDNSAVFRPAAFTPASDHKVAWYRVFARPATGCNIKVRLNDYYLEGTGEQVPAFNAELRVGGLTAGEKYLYAVAAYTKDGKLIGNGIGDSTRPILASHRLPVLLTWAFLCQVGYQIGDYETSKEAGQVLWNHFVAEPSPPEETSYVTDNQNDFALTLHRLNPRVVQLSSPVLLRMFLNCIFIFVDINVRQGALFCDKLCDNGPLIKGQLGRLGQCERMLVALELAGWLNEASLSLQAVVQCYGLIAPLIYFKIPSAPVVQVMERCHAILQDIPAHLRTRRQAAISESLHHMIACLTYSLAKVLRQWKERVLANSINDSGRKMLAAETDKERELRLEQMKAAEAGKEKNQSRIGTDLGKTSNVGEGNTDQASVLDAGGQTTAQEQHTETGSLTLAALKKKKATRKGRLMSGSPDFDIPGNEELKALEAHMLRLSKQAQGEHELSGNEEPSILYAYIAYLPSKTAYKEVVKFKRRARYLEFFVQLAQKALSEGLVEQALDWGDDTVQWLIKRNEGLLGSKAVLQKQSALERNSKYAATVVEYSKEAQGGQKTNRSQKKGKRPKYKAIGITNTMTDAEKQAQEEAELRALDILYVKFVSLMQTNSRRKRYRRISQDELPWRCQLNVIQGLCQFGVLLQRLDMREKMLGNKANHMYKTSFLDQEWFTFETAGTLVVGWEGGPSRQVTRNDNRAVAPSQQLRRASGIEIAAQAATGKPPASLFAIPLEDDDTPRTYRSEAQPTTRKAKLDKKGKADDQPETTLITAVETQDLLQQTLRFFQRAIVLAHRGQHWTLLQNACRSLWNCVHTALLRCYSSDGNSLLTVDDLRTLAWKPFYLAVDCLLDMVLHLQENVFGKNSQGTVVSWVGQVEDEKGGASLKFEPLLDDTSVTDMRWLKRIVLRVIEMLYHEQKWEHLVDTSLRYNAITNNRYAEQINPLVVQAQRKIIQRIAQFDGPPPPQAPFLQAQGERGAINAKIYTQLQLRISSKGDQPNQENAEEFSEAPHSYKLSRVPLDVKLTLDELRQVLDKSHYSARALQHSRRLLLLYLAGQMNVPTEGPSMSQSHVDFKPVTARAQPTMPTDLSREEFLSMDDVQTSPLPKSQVTVVISSYEKTIEMLLANNQRGLAAEAMRELANVHYNAGNMKGAYHWWSESLDMLLNMKNAIKHWRSQLGTQEDGSTVLLNKCGLWGCVLGAVLAANIAQYVLTSNLDMKTECCFLSGYFFKALFRASLPHPRADRDYALYDIGEGCEVTYLIPGIDLLSERFRCDGRTLVSSLQFVTDELAKGRHNLFVLPLLSLIQYFTTFVCRDLQRCVESRIRKVIILTDLGLYGEAFTLLTRLMHGERLPHTADSNFRQLESRGLSSQFDTTKPLLDPNNIKVLESVLDKRLPSNLGMLYGPHLTCHMSIAQAHLFITLANTIHELPKFEDGSVPGSTFFLQPHTIATMSKAGGGLGLRSLGTHSKPAPTVKKGIPDTPRGDAGEEVVARSGKRFSSSQTPVTPAIVKGALLATADQILSILSDIITENAISDKGLQEMSAAEVEMVVSCKLELANIAEQRQHSALAGSIVLTAMRILQTSNIFSSKSSSPPLRKTSAMRGDNQASKETGSVRLVELESSLFQLQNFQSRTRLDARLWLSARLSLVKCLMGELKGMGQVKGTDSTVKSELGDVRQYCAEGVAEAEACGDAEMQAEFLMQGVLLDMLEGSPVEATTALLQEIKQLLLSIKQLSGQGRLLLSWAEVHMTDLQLSAVPIAGDNDLITRDFLPKYLPAHGQILDQLQALGESTEHYYPRGEMLHLSTLVSPIQNLYLPHLLLLVQVKLRIAHAVARNVAKQAVTSSKENDKVVAEMWAQPLGVLKTALELCQVMVTSAPSLEAEILLLMGKVQHQLLQLGYMSVSTVVSTLLRAIEVTFAYDHDLGLMRQAYLELAGVYLWQLPLRATSSLQPQGSSKRDVSPVPLASEQEADGTASKSGSAVSRTRRKPKSRTNDGKTTTAAASEVTDGDLYKAWLAIRCAAAVGQAQRNRLLLPGMRDVTTLPVDTAAQQQLPEYVLLDLLAGYILGDKKRIYKNDIEEELAPLTEALEPPVTETYEDQLTKARQAACDLSWIHILGYQSILQRLSSTATLTSVKSPGTREVKVEAGDLGAGLDLGFISRAQFERTLNHDVVRSVLSAPVMKLRITHLHRYLTRHLLAYKNCIAVYPPKALYATPTSTSGAAEVPVIFKSYLENRITPLDAPETQPEQTYKPDDKALASPTEAEVCMQWYFPALNETTAPPDKDKQVRQILLMVAINGKRGASVSATMMWVPMSQLLDLHDRLALLTQRGEISLMDKAAKKDKEPVPPSQPASKAKKQARIKPLSPKLKRDEHLEELLYQCMTDVQNLLGVSITDNQTPVPSMTGTTAASSQEDLPATPVSQIAFDVTKTNVQNFEKMFDPSFGFVLQDNKMTNWFMKLFR